MNCLAQLCLVAKNGWHDPQGRVPLWGSKWPSVSEPYLYLFIAPQFQPISSPDSTPLPPPPGYQRSPSTGRQGLHHAFNVPSQAGLSSLRGGRLVGGLGPGITSRGDQHWLKVTKLLPSAQASILMGWGWGITSDHQHLLPPPLWHPSDGPFCITGMAASRDCMPTMCQPLHSAVSVLFSSESLHHPNR